MEIKRNIFKTLSDDIFSKEISILIGARQVGKTFLLKKIKSEAQKKGLKTRYFDLEIPSDIIKFNTKETEIFDLLTGDVDVVFIDEFHYLKMPRTYSRRFTTAKRGPKFSPPVPPPSRFINICRSRSPDERESIASFHVPSRKFLR